MHRDENGKEILFGAICAPEGGGYVPAVKKEINAKKDHWKEDGLMMQDNSKMSARRIQKTVLCAALAVLIALTGTGCEGKKTREIALGDGLPVWETEFEVRKAKLPKDAASSGLCEVYAAKQGTPTVEISRLEGNGMSLEEYGQALASEHGIFCNLIEDRGVPAAVLNYYNEQEQVIEQVYIYQTEEGFTRVCTKYPTEEKPFGSDGATFHMIRGYEEKIISRDEPYAAEYSIDSKKLPAVAVREFSADATSDEAIAAGFDAEGDAEAFDAYAQDGWTMEEWIAFYEERFDLKKGEIIERNGLDAAFIGYVDDGIFKVRAFLSMGDGYVLLSAEDDAADFQHVTNALIDTVSVE